MTITVSGRALLLLSTGLWICLAGPAPYAASAATDAPGVHHLKKSGRHASSDDTSKTADAKTADASKADGNDDGAAPASSADLPPSVANANAQAAAAAAAKLNPVAGDRSLNSPQSVFGAPPAAQAAGSPEQPSDAASPPATVMAAADAPAAVTASPATAEGNGESSSWDKTSLIGKIFVGCGALLTMASAVRMFWA
jgi:hypothetical protein